MVKDSVKCLKVHLVRKKRIDGMRIKDFVESCDESRVYLLDIDPYFGREMNFKVYQELAGIYDLWIDAAPRRVEDVMDSLISDAELAVITGVYFWDSYEELFEITDNVAMKSIFPNHISEFVKAGGKIIIVPKNMTTVSNGGEVYEFRGREVCPWKP